MKTKTKYKITLIKFIKYLHLINMMRYKNFLLCTKAGIPFVGLFHDISLYSKDEFWENVKYFNQKLDSTKNAKIEQGYSKAWLHHVGHNKYEYLYWYDETAINKTPIIPYKYVIEMVCDDLTKGIIRQGKNWDENYPINNWLNNRNEDMINKKIDKIVTRIYMDISKKGIDSVIKKEYLHTIYNKEIK